MKSFIVTAFHSNKSCRFIQWLYSTIGLAITLFCITGCNNETTLFKKISADHSNIHFNNKVVENDSINPIDLDFLYNGGGVAVGDFNNDGLQDLYFTASTVSNKLYLNKGDMEFEDVTDKAHVTGEGMWCNAASVIDINNDGLQDIYVCTTIKKNPAQRRNLLYINQGKGKEGVPVFKEEAAGYGLADTSFAVQAGFFDYDNDGDLDMYLVTTKLTQRDAVQFGSRNANDTLKTDADKLFRNDWSESLRHPVFTDVSKQAGITDRGYGLGLSIVDINQDGWKDVYVDDDFYTSDLLYINNKNGTFTNKLSTYFKHTAQNAMGIDIADINNDGLADVLSVDMNPEDNYRKKKNMNGNNYYVYQSMVSGEYMLQYIRNTLQLNQGPRINSNDSTGDPIFSDIGYFSGVAETDWSWNPSIADFDNDGYRDILITNGYPRDVTDHDFVAFRATLSNIASKEQLIDQIPQIKVPNYAFKNTGNLKFENVTDKWGLQIPSFSNGAVYADLDNDGDLDYVINNINDEAFVYENTLNTKKETKGNYLQVSFKGDKNNVEGLGAIVEIYYGNKKQVYENSPYRGYLSTVAPLAYFGLGTVKQLDSVIIKWQNGKKQLLQNVAVNQLLKTDISNANLTSSASIPAIASANLFSDITTTAGIHYQHKETDYIDFNAQRLLPHKLSQYGPGLAAGDLDGNKLDDIIVGGTGDFAPQILLQQPDGKFIQKAFPSLTGVNGRRPENMGILLFDVDNDGDNDVYFANGSNEFAAGSKNYQDRLYINDGKANFTYNEAALPENYTSKSCVKATDFDNDGDLDLFVGGRVYPSKYPEPVSSFIFRNDSKAGKIQFTDVTAPVAKGLQNIGLVCDALWTDFDNDGFTDLIVAGEWMPLRFFKNDHGVLKNISAPTDKNKGWWNSITAGDFDNDGDIDYIAGNLGENSFYRGSAEHPITIYGKDFDNNNGYDIITSLYLKDEEGKLKEFPAQTRDDVVDELPALKKKFLTYKEFAQADINAIIKKDSIKNMLVLQADYFKSVFIKNLGNGKFEMHPLPPVAQIAPIYGMVADDFNHDGNLDVALVGNDYGTEVSIGRYDAMNGLILLGNGKGNFTPQTILQSGFFVPADAKALVKLTGANNNYLLAASQNKGPLKLFKNKLPQKIIRLNNNDKFVLYHLKSGATRREELYFNTSFLSQSSRFISLNSSVNYAEVVNSKGVKRIYR